MLKTVLLKRTIKLFTVEKKSNKEILKAIFCRFVALEIKALLNNFNFSCKNLFLKV